MNSKFQSNTFIFLERLWLIGAIVGIAGVIYFLTIKDNDSALYFFCFFILSALIYLMRKRQRAKHEAYVKYKEQERRNKM